MSTTFPLGEPLISEPKPLYINTLWYRALNALLNRVQQAAYVAVTVPTLVAQAASLPTTPIVPLAAAGAYRVSATARVTQAATTSSSLVPTVSYTRSAQTCSQAGVALTSNAVSLPASWTFLIHVDDQTPISVSTTYGSIGGVSMEYELDVIVEKVA